MPETKCQSNVMAQHPDPRQMKWHPRLPSKPQQFNQAVSTRKVIAIVFWARKGPLFVEFMPHGPKMNAVKYC